MPGSILIKSDNNFADALNGLNMNDRAAKYKDQPGGDYLKKIIN